MRADEDYIEFSKAAALRATLVDLAYRRKLPGFHGTGGSVADAAAPNWTP